MKIEIVQSTTIEGILLLILEDEVFALNTQDARRLEQELRSARKGTEEAGGLISRK